MSVVGLSVYEMYTENGSVIVARVGELTNVNSSPASGTTYTFPSGGNYLRAQEWGDKTFLIQSDQALNVQVLESEDGGATFQLVQGASVSTTQFKTGVWNSIETSMGLKFVQLQYMTQGVAPTKVTVSVRFTKE